MSPSFVDSIQLSRDRNSNSHFRLFRLNDDTCADFRFVMNVPSTKGFPRWLAYLLFQCIIRGVPMLSMNKMNGGQTPGILSIMGGTLISRDRFSSNLESYCTWSRDQISSRPVWKMPNIPIIPVILRTVISFLILRSAKMPTMDTISSAHVMYSIVPCVGLQKISMSVWIVSIVFRYHMVSNPKAVPIVSGYPTVTDAQTVSVVSDFGIRNTMSSIALFQRKYLMISCPLLGKKSKIFSNNIYFSEMHTLFTRNKLDVRIALEMRSFVRKMPFIVLTPRI